MTLVVAIVAGSMLTMAYSLRFWWGAFGTRRRVQATPVDHVPSVGFLAGPALLGLAQKHNVEYLLQSLYFYI